MELFFSPLACSMASRIALYEAGADARYTQVDLKTKRMADGSDFFAVNPMGQVPMIRTDAGELLAENAVVLQYIADQYPGAKLSPSSGMPRYQLQQWLSFISTELHKGIFVPMFDPKASEAAKGYAREKAALRFERIDRYLKGREFLLEGFSVADAYLVTVLNWAGFCGFDLANWPNLGAYYQRLLKRPSVARAAGEEFAMYQKEQAAQAQT